MNRKQVDSLAAILGVTFRPVSAHNAGKICNNNDSFNRCTRRATEEAVKKNGKDVVAVPTCSDADCRISAAIHAYALSLPLGEKATGTVVREAVVKIGSRRKS